MNHSRRSFLKGSLALVAAPILAPAAGAASIHHRKEIDLAWHGRAVIEWDGPPDSDVHMIVAGGRWTMRVGAGSWRDGPVSISISFSDG